MSEELWNTIKSLEEERDKFAKKERGKTFERRPQKFDVHEHAKLDLHELAAVRQVPPGRLAGRILEEVVSLWAKNATDRNLYLKRVENPREADIEISQESAKGLVMDMGNSETFTLNLLTQVVMHYYENGGCPEKIYHRLGFIKKHIDDSEIEDYEARCDAQADRENPYTRWDGPMRDLL